MLGFSLFTFFESQLYYSGTAPEFAYIIENVVPSDNWDHLKYMMKV